jgi:hemerythrin-like domain-containing protein
MTVAPSFSLLAEVHHWLNQLFLDHQLALLSLDLPAASACLERYDSNLKLHIDDEESALIPLYDARTDNVPGGAVELFTGEHTKLTGFIAEFHQTLLAITGKSDRDLRLDIIKLFDREAICKGLVEHHHAREHNILFPWLDKITSENERTDLLANCASLRAWREAK